MNSPKKKTIKKQAPLPEIRRHPHWLHRGGRPHWMDQQRYVVLTTSAGIMDHEEARRKHLGGKILGYFF